MVWSRSYQRTAREIESATAFFQRAHWQQGLELSGQHLHRQMA